MKQLTNTFLLCGYPRSRTLWLANFFTIPGVSVCDHEGLEFAENGDEFWKNARYESLTMGVRYYGNSDSSNMLVLSALLARRPLTKVAWIDRPMAEVRASMLAAGFPFPPEVEEALIRYRQSCEALFDLVIPYAALSEMTAVRALWQLVLPGLEFDYGRWGQLADKVLRYDSGNYDFHNPARIRKLAKFIQNEGEQIVWA